MRLGAATLVAFAALVACSQPEQAVSAPSSASASSTAMPAISIPGPQHSSLQAPVPVVSTSVIDSGLAARMRYSYRSSCPVPLSKLRYLRLRYWTFDGRSRVGEMVVHQDAVSVVGAAFNCRIVAGSTSRSEHAHGRAMDINPSRTPMWPVPRSVLRRLPGTARRVPLRRGTLGATAVAGFTSQGWGWGGNWRTVKDYQHFSANGR